jgi:hypothetical protein
MLERWSGARRHPVDAGVRGSLLRMSELPVGHTTHVEDQNARGHLLPPGSDSPMLTLERAR